MFRFNELKLSKDPRQFGSLVKGYKKCGKENCKCFTKGELHEYHCLKWREYNPFVGQNKVHKKYIKKADVAKLQCDLAKSKGFYIWNKLSYRQQSYLLLSCRDFPAEYINIIVYQLFKKPPYPITA